MVEKSRGVHSSVPSCETVGNVEYLLRMLSSFQNWNDLPTNRWQVRKRVGVLLVCLYIHVQLFDIFLQFYVLIILHFYSFFFFFNKWLSLSDALLGQMIHALQLLYCTVFCKIEFCNSQSIGSVYGHAKIPKLIFTAPSENTMFSVTCPFAVLC